MTESRLSRRRLRGWFIRPRQVVDGGQNLPGSMLFNTGVEQMLQAQVKEKG